MDYTILVNKQNPLDENYIPNNLIDTNTRYNQDRVDSNHKCLLVEDVYIAFLELRKNALVEANIDLEIESAYRSYAYQQDVLADKVKKIGKEAFKICALPGTSEHQTGLAVDFIYYENGETIDKINDSQFGTQWVHNNCYKYGFYIKIP